MMTLLDMMHCAAAAQCALLLRRDADRFIAALTPAARGAIGRCAVGATLAEALERLMDAALVSDDALHLAVAVLDQRRVDALEIVMIDGAYQAATYERCERARTVRRIALASALAALAAHYV